MKQFLQTIAAVFVLSAAAFAQNALEIGKPIERELKAGETQQFQINLQKGKFLNALVNQQGVDVIVRVFAPDNSKVADIDAPIDDRGSEVIALEAKTDGTHRIEIVPFDKTKSGRYTMTLLSSSATAAYAPPLPTGLKDRQTGFLKRSTVALNLPSANYRVYLPIDYDAKKEYPVILCLHGAGERGNDNEQQMGGVTLGSVIQLYNRKKPEIYRSFIAVFPQTENYWFGSATEQAIIALDQTVADRI